MGHLQRENQQTIYDIAVIGGGPAGYTAALEAARYKKKVILFERGEMGGVCLNEGCIPLKSFLHVSRIYRKSFAHGLKPSEPSIEYIKKTAQENIKKLKNGLLYSLKTAGIEIVNAEAEQIEKSEFYKIATSKGAFFSRDVIAATGSEQVIPSINGLADAIQKKKAVTSREFFELREMPDEVLILGAGAVGIEIASFYTDMGRQVTLIDSKERILGDIDDDILQLYMNQLEKQGMRFLLGVDICEVETEDKVCVIYRKDGEIDEVSGDCLVIAAGRKPVGNFNHVEGIYICGDANGKSMLAHTAIQEAAAAVHKILGEERQADYSQIPAVIYSSPELSWIGGNESKNTAADVSKKTMDFSSRYVIDADGVKGCIKIIKEKEKILGCQIVGDGGSELIAFMLSGNLDKIVYPHPSVSEILREVL